MSADLYLCGVVVEELDKVEAGVVDDDRGCPDDPVETLLGHVQQSGQPVLHCILTLHRLLQFYLLA